MIFQKLKERIKKDLGLELSNFRRTNAGKHQKGSGAFAWTAIDLKRKHIYGSGETATTLVKRKEPLEIVEELRTAQTQFEIS